MALIRVTGGSIASNTITAENIVSNINLGGSGPRPTVTSIVYPGGGSTVSTTGNQSVTLNGNNFAAGMTIMIGNTISSVVTVSNTTSLTFTTPAKSAGTYIIYAMKTDGAISLKVPGLTYA